MNFYLHLYNKELLNKVGIAAFVFIINEWLKYSFRISDNLKCNDYMCTDELNALLLLKPLRVGFIYIFSGPHNGIIFSEKSEQISSH